MTVRAWISSSLRLLGVLAAGETVDADAGADAMVVASDMLDSWAAERLTMYEQLRSLNPLVALTGNYTIGAGGNWTQERPLWIDGAAYLTADGLEQAIDVFTRDQWQAIAQKDLTNSLPEGIFYNPAFPLGAISVWPVPTDATVQIVLYAPLSPLKSVTSLDTVISLPEGWAKALRYSLALELAPEYGVEPMAAVVVGAVESKATIKRPNVLGEELVIDAALRRSPVSGWSIRTGDFIR